MLFLATVLTNKLVILTIQFLQCSCIFTDNFKFLSILRYFTMIHKQNLRERLKSIRFLLFLFHETYWYYLIIFLRNSITTNTYRNDWNIVCIVHVYVYIFLYTCMYVCMYVYMYMYVCVYVHIFVYMYGCMYVCIYLHVCMCLRIYVRTYVHMHIHTYIHSVLFTFVDTCRE